MHPLAEHSSNTAGSKRRPSDEEESEDVEIMETTASDWHAAAHLSKKPKIRHNVPASHRPRQESQPDLEEGDLRGRSLQRHAHIPHEPARQSTRLETHATRKKWTADPSRLPPKQKGKKLKYYGVLFGGKPGIYYSWDEAEPLVKGHNDAVFISSTEAREIEDFMNHVPADCRWAICAKKCYKLPPFETTTVAYPDLAIAEDTTEQIPSLSRDLPSTQESTVETICNCGKLENSGAPTVQCANVANCTVGTYHKKCVGLASRKETVGWRCVDCRPLPSSMRNMSSPQSSSLNTPPPTYEHQVAHRMPSSSISGVNPLISAEPEPPLHPEQERIVDTIMQGYNVFYTGSAGVGKSTVLKNLVSRLEKENKRVDKVTPSGISALNIGGMTTYSYAGWTPDSFKEPLEKIMAAAHGKKVRKRLCKTDVLVIDEISMVERDMFIRLDQVMREARHGWKDPDNPGQKSLSVHDRRAPFGGVQLVVTGDFCQLPPVKPFRFCLYCGGNELPGRDKNDGRPLTCKKCSRQYLDQDKWAFRCDNWDHCEFLYFELKHIHRQSDIEFINILQKCRYDIDLLPSEKALLMKPKPDPLGAVKLLPRRNEVEAENASKFRLLQGTIREYSCLDIFSWRSADEPDLKKKGRPRYPDQPDGPLEALKDHRYEERIELKVGMLVILLCNLSFPDGLVNGSQGKIIGFEPYDPNKPVVPKPRDPSPGRSGKGKENTVHMERTAFQEAQIRKFVTLAKSPEWPIVQFNNGITRPIYASCPVNELGIDKPYSLLARTQIPLLAAWAITIHKSQGLSLSRVIVNLQNTFEREQIYVALSRATSLEGLKVIQLPNARDRGRNPEVAEFLGKHFGESKVGESTCG